MEEVM